jgi:hypothetical protein
MEQKPALAMKKFILAIFAFVYLAISSGFTVHMHYCMDKLADINFFDTKNKESNCGPSSCGIGYKANSCCKDESKLVKIADVQQSVDSKFHVPETMAYVIPVSFYQLPATEIVSAVIEHPQSNSPPLSRTVPIYILNCVYRL